MKRLDGILLLFFLICPCVFSQTTGLSSNAEEIVLRKQAILSELKNLALETSKISDLLQRARVNAEIADAAWNLDRRWSKQLLREAYKLTYPTEEELDRISTQIVGGALQQPNSVDLARSDLRSRIFNIARRDEAFVDQLITESSKYVGWLEQQSAYSTLARYALDDGDNQTAISLIEKTVKFDPTQAAFTSLVNDLAKKDREAADKLILQCIAGLRRVSLSNQTGSAGRAYFNLRWLVFPNSIFPDPNARVPEPGPSVLRGYAIYVVESLANMQQKEPGGLRFNRSVLLSAWLPLKTHAPELTTQYLQLEALSRAPGQEASLPTQSYEEADKERFRKLDNRALNSNEPDARSINSAINREEFELAHNLIDKLPDGQKGQLLELLNAKEAVSLANNGELLKAKSLAEKLTTANSIVQVYSVIISRAVTNKDRVTALATIQQGIKQLQTADTKPFSVLPGMPASMMSSEQGSSAVLSGLLKLAMAILPVDDMLALEILDQVVTAANKSELQTTTPVVDLMGQFLRKIVAQDDARTFVTIQKLKDPFFRAVALAAVYQWKTKELEKLSHTKAPQGVRSKPEDR